MPFIGKLKALEVARKTRAGMYGDGRGLYLQLISIGCRTELPEQTSTRRRRDRPLT
jgi:hypothetical protein